MQNPLDLEIRRRIDQFLSELDALVRNAAVESVQAALSDSGSSARRGPSKTAKHEPKGAPARGKARKRVRRSSELVAKLGDLVQAFVASHPGARLEHISSGVQVESRELKRPLRTLVASGTLRSEGRRRGTRYFPAGGRGSGKRASIQAAPKSARKAKAGKKASAAKDGAKALAPIAGEVVAA